MNVDDRVAAVGMAYDSVVSTARWGNRSCYTPGPHGANIALNLYGYDLDRRQSSSLPGKPYMYAAPVILVYSMGDENGPHLCDQSFRAWRIQD